MGKLRNFLKSSSQKDKISLKMKNSGTKKSREGGSQPHPGVGPSQPHLTTLPAAQIPETSTFLAHQ